MASTRYFNTWQRTLMLSVLCLLLLPAALTAASIGRRDTRCPVTDSHCSCNFKDSFYIVRCSSLSAGEDFRAVVRNSTQNAIILEVDDANFDYLPLNDLQNSSVHTLVIGNSTFRTFQNYSELISSFLNLRHLSLENVTFHQELQWENLRLLDHLQVLFLHNVTLQDTIPANFSKLISKELMALTIAQSNLTNIEEKSFEEFKNLMTLRISHNKITTFSRRVLPEETSKLEQIRLDHNKIHSLPSGTFESLPSLTFVSLSNNSLSTIPQEVFEPLWNPKVRVDLRANPLKCDCRLLWTVKAESKPSSLIGQCTHPKRLFGKSIESLTEDDLNC